MLCRNCKHCKSARVGYVSSRSWCKLTGDGWNGKAMGVYPWLDKPHPKCPLKKQGLSDTHQKTTKEVKKMSKADKVIKYYLDSLDTMYKEESFEEMTDFLGTGICDGFCGRSTDNCQQGCALFSAVHQLIDEPTDENLNEVKSIVCQIIHQKI